MPNGTQMFYKRACCQLTGSEFATEEVTRSVGLIDPTEEASLVDSALFPVKQPSGTTLVYLAEEGSNLLKQEKRNHKY